MVGSQSVPYIFEDYADTDSIADGIYKIYSLSKEEKLSLSKKVKNYAQSEFSYQKTIDLWHDSLEATIKDWKQNRKNITIEEF